MIELDVTFNDRPLETLLASLKRGRTLSAVRLLTLSEGEDEQTFIDALEVLEEKCVALDMAGLTVPPVGPEAAARLRMEEKLAREGMRWEQLDSTDPLRIYLQELAEMPVCGDVAMLADALSASNCAGKEDSKLRTQLVELSLSRVVELASGCTGQGVLLLDLIQEGCIGLWRATECFQGRGVDFEAERDRWVRFYMNREIICQARSAGVGQRLQQAMEDYRKADEQLLVKLGRDPQPEELAEVLHLSLQETLRLSQQLELTRSLQQTYQPEPEQLPQEDDQAVEDTAYFKMRQRIAELLSTLSAEDAQLLTQRYGLQGGLPLKPAQVAARMGMTVQEVIDREAAALARLREIN